METLMTGSSHFDQKNEIMTDISPYNCFVCFRLSVRLSVCLFSYTYVTCILKYLHYIIGISIRRFYLKRRSLTGR